MWILTCWQLWPAYALIAGAFVVPHRFRWLRRILLGGLACCAAAVWLILPIPLIPKPAGPYAVGTRVFRWVDAAREEAATDDPADRRNVIGQLFYPASAAGGPHARYMDGVGRLPHSVSGMPSFLLRHFDHADSQSFLDAPVESGRRWPLVVFSPGYGATRSFYTAFVTGLASRGYVVLAVDHPYEAGVAELADGRVVGNVVRRLPGDPDLLHYMASQQDIRVADIRFAMDRVLADVSWAGIIDTGRIYAVGHSFGGAASLAAMAADSRISAAVNLDGTPYGDLSEQHLHGPAMWVRSDLRISRYSPRFLTDNQRILAQLSDPAEGRQFEFADVNHFSFTDFPLFFSPPGRWLVGFVMPGRRPPDEVHGAALALVDGFLSGKGEGADRAADRFPWIRRGKLTRQ